MNAETGPSLAAPPGRLGAWWLAARPRTLSLAVTPVLVGASLAGRTGVPPAWSVILAALLAAVLIQIGTNLHNDAADFLRGADTPDRLGPPRATARGWLSAAAVLRGSYLTFAAAFLVGLYLVSVGGWPILLLGLLCLGAGLAYTGGPRPVAYSSLGEVFVFLFFGLAAVGGTHYLLTGTLGAAAIAAGAAIGGPAAAVLLVNNYRDLDTDRRAGKLTLAARLGRARSRRLYAALLALPFLLTPPLHWLTGSAGVWLGWLALPLAASLVRSLASGLQGAPLNEVLARTARLQLLYSLALCAGILLPPWSSSGLG